MAKYALGITILSTAVVLTAWAASPPNLERTLEAQRQIVAERPADSTAHSDLGNLLLLADDVVAAEAAYRRAKELDSSNSAAGFNLGLLMQQTDRGDEATTEFEAVLDVEPKHAWAHYQLGVIQHHQRNRTSALEHYAKAFAYDPSLTFAENNPHFIDNDLAVEALLMSSRYQRDAGARVPRHYADADRILKLMLEEEAKEEENKAEGDKEAPAADPAKAERPSPAAGSSTGGSVRFDDDEDEAEEDEGEEIAADSSSRRVLTNSDLEPSKGGTTRPQAGGAVVRSGSGGTSNAKVRSSPRYRRRASTLDDGREAPERTVRPSTPAAPTARPRYRPGRRSTANLNLEVVQSPAEARG